MQTPKMKMKNKFIIVLTTIILLNISVLAQSTDIDFGDANVGDANYDIMIKESSLFNKIKLFFSGAGGELSVTTTGAPCTVEPSFSEDLTVSSLGYVCADSTSIERNLGSADGWIFQLFDISGNLLGQREILPGERECIDATEGKQVHYDLYICKENFQSSCVETDAGKNIENFGRTTITFEGQTQTYDDVCFDDNYLVERFCEQNTINSQKIRCVDGCLNGECVSSEIDEEEREIIEELEAGRELKVAMTDLKIQGVPSGRVDVLQGELYEISGIIYITQGVCDGCVVETGGNFYGQQYSVISEMQGACGDDNTVGVKFDAIAGDAIQFFLYDKVTDPQKLGRIQVPVSVYSGCGGELLDIDYYIINVKEQYIPEEREVECYKCENGLVRRRVFLDECPEDYTEFEIEECEIVEDEEGEIIEEEPVFAEEQEYVKCYWCEGNFVKSDFYLECPESTSTLKPNCNKEPVSYCDNNPEAPGCEPEICMPGDTREICEMICCNTNGEYDWEYKGQCLNAVNNNLCEEGIESNVPIIIAVVGLFVLLMAGMVILIMRKKK